MLSSLKLCAVTLTQIHTSKVKVTQHIVRCYKSRIHFPSFFSQNNLDIDLTYTTHSLNNFNKYPSITCSYIQEYLGYRSNNLYFLFSHSWPVVVYSFVSGLTYQSGWEKTKCSKKTGDITVLWTALLILLLYYYHFYYLAICSSFSIAVQRYR